MKIKTIIFEENSFGKISAKRVFDLFFSLFALVLLFPIFLLIGLCIFISSPGKVIYSQHRLGRSGKIFRCYKFRTMHQNADEILKNILKNNPTLLAEWKVKQKLKEDPRIFYFGKFLRKTSLDELPQFWNVFKGDLSVVGPRPYMISQRHALNPFYYKILSIRPGLTGLWQTSGRSNTTFLERIELDAKYVDIHSTKLDLQLILKTLIVMFKNAC